MTHEQLAAMAKHFFYIFPKLVSGAKIPRHLKFVGEEIQTAIEKKSDKNRMLIISMPPRSGKSQLISKHLPAWYLGKYPKNRVILTSYSSELSDQHSDYAKEIFSKWGPYLFDVKPSKTTFNRSSWDTEFRGGCISAGVGGSITGFGSEIMIIDDYCKGHEDAESKTQREKLWNWWQSVASSRLHPNSTVLILCMAGDTRISMADGSWKYLKDVKIGDEVLSYKDNKIIESKVLDCIKRDKDQLFEIKTGNNTIKATARHPFLVELDSGRRVYKKVIDLYKGDSLVSVSRNDNFNNNKINKKQAWILGFMFGDGWLTHRKSRSYSKDGTKYYQRRGIITCVAKGIYDKINNKVLKYFKDLWDVDLKLKKEGYYRTEVQVAGRWLNAYGLSGNAHTKRLPNFIFSECLKNRLAFLHGFVSADGHNIKNGNYKAFGATSCNMKLIDDVRQLARSCGYNVQNTHFTRRKATPPHSKHVIDSESYSFEFSAKRTNKPFTINKIRSIKKVDNDYVYDITVENTECFLADGIVSHNCTRWHSDDLSGRLIQQYNEEGDDFPFDFKHINLPAIAEEDDPLGRKPGEALWPERFSANMLMNVKKTAGPFVWASLWQGNPRARGGNLFKSMYFRYWTLDWITNSYVCHLPDQDPMIIPSKDLRRIVIVDPALEIKTRNDPSGMLAWGYSKKYKVWLLLDALKGKIKHEILHDTILNFAFRNKCSEIFVENEKIGKILIKQSSGRDKMNGVSIPFKEVKTKNKDKFSRCIPIASYMENGRVFFKKDAPWLEEYESDITVFPDSDDDCWADCTGHASILEKSISVAEALARAMKLK